MWFFSGWFLAGQASAEPAAAAQNPSTQEAPSWEGAVEESAVNESAQDESAASESAESRAETVVVPDAPEAASARPDLAQSIPAQSIPAQSIPAQPAAGVSGSARGDASVGAASTGLGAHRVTAIALTGLSFLGVGVGASYAIQSTSSRREADMHCTPTCTPEADRHNQKAHEAATVAQVAFAVGLVALGGAAYLWLTEPEAGAAAAPAPRSGARSARSLEFDISAGPGLTTAWLGGTF